ncbi:MAG TPA: PilZ domain-containing protein [Terriglobales bacterium]|nr:PilZ domain-containing protein [Terriglobales bacterium]
MDVRSLLLTEDQDLTEVFQQALQDLGIGVELYSSASWASEDIRDHKFDALIVDCDVQGAPDFLESIRKSPSNVRSLTFAIVSSDMGLPAAFDRGANLALQKPITLESARSSLRAAYGLIMQERRRYFRCPLDTTVEISPDETTLIRATAMNISEGGMALKSERELQINGLVKARFSLPGVQPEFDLRAIVVWKDAMGRAGLRFESVSTSNREKLCEWLGMRLEALS